MGAETFSFTIDGVEVEASPGQSVVEACDLAGIYIPRLCYHPDLEPSGTCGSAPARSTAATAPPA
ncbi:MAG: 2Fe-2S iron-sulfur cluster-binding protein [Methylovirgula sp.]